ncbi:type II secretion system protein GspG [Haloferula sp. BvORR071]|uniref:type II secretion system protein GspG n=1 Tax=Haloferula sp. BvORR071 TaxID=1396141 RepID=UPI000698954F|nr:type II secretion system protein GspG [Haloferula sp. BvORR071]
MVSPSLFNPGNKLLKAGSDIKAIALALEKFKAECGRYPDEPEGLGDLVVCPPKHHDPAKWQQLLKEYPVDPWMTRYSYRLIAEKSPGFEIRSAGEDQRFGTKDDLSSLDE